MKNGLVFGSGLLGLLAAACASQHATTAPASQAPETQGAPAAAKLVPVERPGMTLADALSAAAAEHGGFVPVAVGIEDEGGTRYDVALLSQGRVQEVVVDAASGKLSAGEERAVHPGQEAFAAKLEALLPSAKIDLARSVEIALTRGEGARPLGAQIDIEDDRLVYSVTVLAGSEPIQIAIDSVSGEVLRTESAADMDEDGDAQDATFEMQDEAPSLVDEDFAEVPAGRLPESWKVETTGSAAELATWSVVADDTAPTKGHALALTKTNHDSKSAFNLCWTDSILFGDGSIEASMKPVSGAEDQGGGLVWRVQDKDDYYLCRANPLEKNFRVYVVQDGKRRELASADVDAAAGAWHRIRVEQEGEHIVCSLDGKKLLEASDATVPGQGGIGFWTKADAVSSFTGLLVASSSSGREQDEDESDDEMDGDKR
jgi:uncharacterized membrane protein YkoI